MLKVVVALLTLDRVSLAFGHLPLFEDASLRIDAGERICLIGRNGTGKSSLLKVVAGEQAARRRHDLARARAARLAARSGRAGRGRSDGVRRGRRRPRRARATGRATITTPPMHLADTPAGLERLGELQHQLEERDGWRLEQKVETGRVAAVAAGGSPDARAVGRLAPARRCSARRSSRSRISCCSTSRPIISTSTRSTGSRSTCATFTGALLFVTHDRAFLSALATRIVDLDRGTLTSWPGYLRRAISRRRPRRDEAEARALDRLDKKLAQEEAWLRQGVKARRTRNEGRVKALMALRAERAAQRAPAATSGWPSTPAAASGKLVFEAEHVGKSFGGVPVIRDYTQRILRGDRIGLIGPNGSGKTTLLRLLVGELEPDSGDGDARAPRLEIAYFDQQREQLDPDRTVADSVNDGNDTVIVNGQPRHVIGYLADFLFPRERALSPVKSLSGGERNRLMLARLFARPANVLVLDEPTNDLDIETLELLEELVADFAGTVLLVSHDRAFLDNVVTSTLAFEGERPGHRVRRRLAGLLAPDGGG